jgi:hypothetical protein
MERRVPHGLRTGWPGSLRSNAQSFDEPESKCSSSWIARSLHDTAVPGARHPFICPSVFPISRVRSRGSSKTGLLRRQKFASSRYKAFYSVFYSSGAGGDPRFSAWTADYSVPFRIGSLSACDRSTPITYFPLRPQARWDLPVLLQITSPADETIVPRRSISVIRLRYINVVTILGPLLNWCGHIQDVHASVPLLDSLACGWCEIEVEPVWILFLREIES